MKKTALVISALIAICAQLGLMAADKPAEKPKPYPLKLCVVSDEKFGGDMGDPYVFTYQGREVKLCCKGCLGDFNKEPAKYVKKMEVGEKKK